MSVSTIVSHDIGQLSKPPPRFPVKGSELDPQFDGLPNYRLYAEKRCFSDCSRYIMSSGFLNSKTINDQVPCLHAITRSYAQRNFTTVSISFGSERRQYYSFHRHFIS